MESSKLITPNFLISELDTESGATLFEIFTSLEDLILQICPDNHCRREAISELVKSFTFSLLSLSSPTHAAEEDSALARLRAARQGAGNGRIPASKPPLASSTNALPDVAHRSPAIRTTPGVEDISVDRGTVEVFDIRPSQVISKLPKYRVVRPDHLCAACQGPASGHPEQKQYPVENSYLRLLCDGDYVLV